ncbi:glycosyltransferase [Paenibacillus sp. PR3]|uniref:Glycosyltransferase n=1 Tax=Paenibacillus terricola TaxID=2763503 RepID=A0ABR8N4X6_9BACL|nr:glycosyltransferase [Paenibacillus terricola]MBD3921514.1 glycosyltransferase [Paenibacillus terricola]
MTRKVVICGNFNFPRGSASANYIQYMALALIEGGFEVHIISSIERSFLQKQGDAKELHYKGIHLHQIVFSDNKYYKNYQLQFLQGSMITKELDKIGLKDNDIIFVSSSVRTLQRKVREYANKHSLKTITCILEWYESSFYKYGKLDFRYWRYLDMFKNVYPMQDALIPISTYINDHFEKQGCRTLLLPIMADISEYPKTERKEHTKKFVFPANGKMKDDLNVMLETIALVHENGYKNVEFHFSGIKESTVREYFKDKFDRLNNKLFFIHKWMDYDELIQLYREMDFLLLARKTSQQTLANFPSKVPETMSYGVIPVVSRVGDYTNLYLRDSIDSIQFPENSRESCYNAIVRAISLSEEEQKAMSNNAYLCVKDRFDYSNWVPQIKRFFDAL